MWVIFHDEDTDDVDVLKLKSKKLKKKILKKQKQSSQFQCYFYKYFPLLLFLSKWYVTNWDDFNLILCAAFNELFYFLLLCDENTL